MCDTNQNSTKIEAPQDLINQTEEFHKQIITVVPGIHCAIGYGLANSILIEGNNGNIIIDTLESCESAEELKKDFKILSSKPIVAIIYTHNHADHIFGAKIFAEDNLNNIKIYSHSKLLEILDNTMNLIQPITFERAARQFGTFLNKETGHINCGIGLTLNYNSKSTRGFLRPTNTFNTDNYPLTIEGRELILYYAPGETDDHIVIYMPKEKILFAADNIYKSFPNIYAIRGTPVRDANQWINSLDLMRNLKSHYLIPSHTRPIKGEEYIYDIITIYRDAIQFIHNQTIRFINQGLTPDEIIGYKLIQLPIYLKKHPYLQEFYGTINWTIRAIFDRYLGWFSGKESDLNVDSPLIRAENLIKLGGGSEKVFESVKQAFQDEKYQWSLELIEALNFYPENLNQLEINKFHILILENLSSLQTSANGRNWYLTKSLEINKLIQIKPSESQKIQTILNSSLKTLFILLSVNLDYKKIEGKNQFILFDFIDKNEKFSLHIRNGIIDIKHNWLNNNNNNIYMIIEIKTELIWKEILARLKNPLEAIEEQLIIIKDQNQQINSELIIQFIEFLLLFNS